MANTPKRFRPRAALSEAPAAPSTQAARLVPSAARTLMALVEDRGLPPDRLCQGLGFSYQDLHDSDLLLSYDQTRALILRALRVLDDPAVGLAMGARQTPVSWGLPGLAMQTCATFGEAILFGLAHQGAAGALVDHRLQESGREVVLEVVPHVLDLQIERFLIDASLSALVAVSRWMMQSDRNPSRVELAYPRPAQADAYSNFFRCPVHFGASAHRLAFETSLLALPVPGHDRITCALIRTKLLTLLTEPEGQHDLVASVAHRLRLPGDRATSQREMAQMVNVSERTLRRRLSAQDVSFLALRENSRYDQARELLTNSALTVAQVAEALGYSDARAFRRAFKRWSGQLPAEFRESGTEG